MSSDWLPRPFLQVLPQAVPGCFLKSTEKLLGSKLGFFLSKNLGKIRSFTHIPGAVSVMTCHHQHRTVNSCGQGFRPVSALFFPATLDKFVCFLQAVEPIMVNVTPFGTAPCCSRFVLSFHRLSNTCRYSAIFVISRSDFVPYFLSHNYHPFIRLAIIRQEVVTLPATTSTREAVSAYFSTFFVATFLGLASVFGSTFGASFFSSLLSDFSAFSTCGKSFFVDSRS